MYTVPCCITTKKKYCHECNEYSVFGEITCPKVVRAMEKRPSSLITLGPVEPTRIDKLCPGLHCRRCPLQSSRVGEVESWGTQTSEGKNQSQPTNRRASCWSPWRALAPPDVGLTLRIVRQCRERVWQCGCDCASMYMWTV